VDEPNYAMPEEAALDGYTPAMQARVVSVRMTDDDNAEVDVDTFPSHPMTIQVGRRPDGRWIAWRPGTNSCAVRRPT